MSPEGLFIPWAKRLPENRGAVAGRPPVSRDLDRRGLLLSDSFLRDWFVANWLVRDDGGCLFLVPSA